MPEEKARISFTSAFVRIQFGDSDLIRSLFSRRRTEPPSNSKTVSLAFFSAFQAPTNSEFRNTSTRGVSEFALWDVRDRNWILGLSSVMVSKENTPSSDAPAAGLSRILIRIFSKSVYVLLKKIHAKTAARNNAIASVRVLVVPDISAFTGYPNILGSR